MTIEEIHQTVKDFGDAAARGIAAGFDGVELHGAHGYMIPQFISTYTNKRTDEYGGDLEALRSSPWRSSGRYGHGSGRIISWAIVSPPMNWSRRHDH